MATCGGFGGAKEATAEEQAILESVKGEVEAHLGKTFSVFQAISYTTQVVAGVNYIIKTKCDDIVAHIKIAKPLPHTNKPPFMMAVDANHTEDSPINPI
mmetsp:Transcript_78260/g.153617  ORF Transcript_78260/g.153617 Transcript_78260/m.153617 type:complete len:99 (+) Transcript_78260:42-338(+)|eukprot:CAMPEP_0170377762 /NCGR_PEP_ID=MMETSP0117_2-20130122/12445_1 /TAXON_ID=400756 /ORGANISM="Durinskia baltica, Strain CSIRO CS-38" /LENGTH=98 /DNA_ID=CAMNT_0010633081 /DNA_START=40 /DNA_END=336 /DNA_ORIENTATION=+